MKRVSIFHGTDGKPTDHWLPWIAKEFEQSGYQVYAPLLPGNHTPNKDIYEQFLKTSGWDFADNILVGHSSGATTILNLLSTDWFPHAEVAILASTFLNEKLSKAAEWYVAGQFEELFLPSYDPRVLKAKANRFYFVHSDDDPYCDINDAKQLCTEVGGTFITIPSGHHLGGTSGLKELPQLEAVLRRDGII